MTVKLKDIIRRLTKYYVVFICNDSSRHDDQTVVPSEMLDREVEAIDFYEDDGDGESLRVYLSDEVNI